MRHCSCQGRVGRLRGHAALVVALLRLVPVRAAVPVLPAQLLSEGAAADPLSRAAGMRRLLPQGTAADPLSGAARLRRLRAEMLPDPHSAMLRAVVHVRAASLIRAQGVAPVTSQRRMVASMLPDARSFPSDENATDVTRPR